MAKSVNDAVLDGMLDVIAQATAISVCSQEPTTRTAAVTTYKLATRTLTSGDFTKANGDTSGRKITMALQEDIPIDSNGTATHIALTDGTRLLYVTTCASQALTSGNSITLSAWKVEVADPS